MAIHKDLTGATAVHPFFYPSESDPTSTLGPHKGWVKMSTGELKIRNAANTAWIELKSAADLAAHLTDTAGAHAASAISVLDTAGNFAGVEVETVLDELYDTISSGSVPDATETVKGKAEIATQTETNTGTDDTRFVTPLKLANSTSVTTPDATETVKGKAEIATQTETDAGTDDTRIVTPLKLANSGLISTPDATETVKGKAEIATQTETNTGTDDARIVTPLKLAGRTATETRAGVLEIATQTETNAGTDDTVALTPKKLKDFYAGLGVGGYSIYGYQPPWVSQTSGAVFVAYSDGDPLRVMPYMSSSLGQTVTASQITTTAIRLCQFRLPKQLVVSAVRAFSVAASTGVFTFAIYRVSDGVRMWDSSGGVNTTANAWQSYTMNTTFTLAANTNYWAAIGATTTGATTIFFAPPLVQNSSVYGNPPGSPLGTLDIGLPVGAQQSNSITAGAMPTNITTAGALAGDTARAIPLFLEGTAS